MSCDLAGVGVGDAGGVLLEAVSEMYSLSPVKHTEAGSNLWINMDDLAVSLFL